MEEQAIDQMRQHRTLVAECKQNLQRVADMEIQVKETEERAAAELRRVTENLSAKLADAGA